MSLLFDNEQFIMDKIRALENKSIVTDIVKIEFILSKEDTKHSILIETKDLSVDFINRINQEFQTEINMIFGTQNWTTQIFINRAPILRLLD